VSQARQPRGGCPDLPGQITRRALLIPCASPEGDGLAAACTQEIEEEVRTRAYAARLVGDEDRLFIIRCVRGGRLLT
jgi:hypothetical protein